MAFLISLVLFAIFFVLSEILKPKPEQEKSRPRPLKFPTATEGRPVPLIWGTVKLEAPNVVWYGDLRQKAITEKIKTGMFSSSKVTIGFRYFVGIQMALCRGEVDELRRIWVGDEVLFSTVTTLGGVQKAISIDKPAFFGGDKLGNGGIIGNGTIFPGTENQPASTYLSAFQLQGGDTPAYVGTCYFAWEQGGVGNSTTIKPWKFELRRIPDPLVLAGNASVNSGNDCNPVTLLYELLINDEWGFGLPADDIDTVNFIAQANTLATEGNGISFQLETELSASDFLEEIERQIDGLVFINRTTGKWQINLARAGQTSIGTADETNTMEIKDFTRGTWADTSNIVTLGFSDRVKDYFDTFANAQDPANIRIQGGENVVAQLNFPGVKDATLANALAWRELKFLSRPLAKATLVVDRTFYNANPGDVMLFTNASLGITALQMRITKVDLGELESGKIVLLMIEDVFSADAGSFATQGTNWLAPTDTMVAVPSNESQAIEAPRAFVLRDPELPGQGDRIWCSARNQGDNAVKYTLKQRNAAGTPTGSYSEAGEVFAFMPIGQLIGTLSRSTTNPTTTDVQVDDIPDTVANLMADLVSADTTEIGSQLANMILINDEFMAFENFVDQTTRIDLQTVHRGLLDSAPADHAIGDKVYLITVGGGMTNLSFPRGNNVEIKLQTESLSDLLLEASATVLTVALADRERKPYPPLEPTFNGSGRYPASTTLDTTKSGGTTEDDKGVTIAFRRRDFLTFDEIENRDGVLGPNFPVENNTKYLATARNDPDGLNTLLFTSAANGGEANVFLSRTTILRFTVGVIPSRMRFLVKARHDFETETFDSIQELLHDLNVSSPQLAGDTNLGVLDTSIVSNVYTAPDTGTYTFDIAQQLDVGKVEARINTGSWVTVIAATNLTGTLAGVTSTDTIEVRHDQGATQTVETLIEITAPTSGTGAYGVLIT